jgi:hypothetical protein
MGAGLRFALPLLLTIPAVADLGVFDQIRQNDAITLVLPDGPCDAKVIRREPKQLTAALKDTTRTCGKRKLVVIVSRSDVNDVVDRRSVSPKPDISDSAACFGRLGVGAVTAGQIVAELTHLDRPGLFVMVGGGIAAAVFCHEPRRPRYGVFTERIVPVQP